MHAAVGLYRVHRNFNTTEKQLCLLFMRHLPSWAEIAGSARATKSNVFNGARRVCLESEAVLLLRGVRVSHIFVDP